MKHINLIDPASPLLNKRAAEIALQEISSNEIQSFIDEMLALANGTQGDVKQRTMVGLAAPQVGVLKRVIVVAVNATGLGETPELKVFINPEILERSEEQEPGREGCFSTGCICGVVDRSREVTVRARDRNGELLEEKYRGFVARVFQHEIDHLEGIRFPDRIRDDKNLHWVEAGEFGEYRERWQTWSKKCDRKVWEDMKSKQL